MRLSHNSKMFGRLHCFESVARNMSFTRAGHELGLTQGAMSHTIRALEGTLGFTLFNRFARKISLTHEGERLFAVIRRSLGEIESEVDAIKEQELRGALFVTVPPSLPGCWLLSRLADFRERYPGITLHLRCRNDVVDFENERVDLALYYGHGKHPGLHVTQLMEEVVFPVCSPAYADTHNLWDNLAAIENCLLLHDALPWPNAQFYSEWQMWFDYHSIEGYSFHMDYTFDRSELAVEAAVHGLGLAMGRQHLVADLMARGQLVCPFAEHMHAPQAYWAVMPHSHVQNVRTLALHRWLADTARELRSTPRA